MCAGHILDSDYPMERYTERTANCEFSCRKNLAKSVFIASVFSELSTELLTETN